MDLREFAENWRLMTKRDECGEAIISGKLGQIYEYGAGKLGCTVLRKSARYWNAARRRLTDLGCRVIQDGDSEGMALFDPQHSSQVNLVIRLVGAKRKRELPDSQRANLLERLKGTRKVAAMPDSRFISQRTPSGGAFAGQISTGTAQVG